MGVWNWEQIDAGRSGSSGDLSKLFKNEPIKQPGILKSGAPPADATLLAREAIQNSWDAGRELQAQLEEEGIPPPEFEIRFVFDELTGDGKESVVAALGLPELASRAGDQTDSMDRRKLGLAETDCLDHLDDPDAPLRLLRLEERGTTGMGGPWTEAASKLYLALVSIGFTLKAEGAGGSYGYGKAGLIRGSAIHTVVAHTCFREQPEEDPDVTRRLLGMAYWGIHRAGDRNYTGFARLGSQVGDISDPLTNDDADVLASRLGMPTRDSSRLQDLGSTFLLVDPVVDPEGLREAIERNWWPALRDGVIDVEIRTADGNVIDPRPMSNPTLGAFIRGYELATTSQDNQPSNEFRRDLGTYTPRGDRSYPLGHLGLVADTASWSFAQSIDSDDDSTIDQRSLVALVRGPRMVVEYLDAGSGMPFVRGAVVAHDAIDDLLRQTEPKAHDAWLAKLEEEGIDSAAPKLAKELLTRVRKGVRDFKKSLKPVTPREQDVRLPLLDELLRDILVGTGSTNAAPPKADPRPISIATTQGVEAASESTIRLRATVGFHLTAVCQESIARCRLRFRCAFDEDGTRGSDCPLDFEGLPDGFEVENVDKYGTTVVGDLDHDLTEFAVVSAPYDMDWSVQFIVAADLAGAGQPASAESSSHEQ